LLRFPFLAEDRVVTIPNGYDPEDFPDDLPSPPVDRFVLAYVGTVYRMTSARDFLAGLRLFHERSPELARSLETRFVGRIVAPEEPYFEGTEALGVRRIGYVEHRRAIEELAASHAALCLMPNLEGNSRIYPAKFFEIMRLGRPCLAIAPQGALWKLMRRCRAGEAIEPEDTVAIAETLERWVRRFRDDPSARPSGAVNIERFDRREQARSFANVFRTALAAARDSRAAAPNAEPSRERAADSAS
jgi:glycosyltransferase involved in cell wall biosynthesis